MEKIDLSDSTIQEKVKGVCKSFENAINNLEKQPVFIVISTKEGDEIKTTFFTEGVNVYEEITILNILSTNIHNKIIEKIK